MRARRWVPPLLWAGVILIATSTPNDVVPRQLTAFDKAVHFLMYAPLAFLMAAQFGGATDRRRAALLAVIVAMAFGIADEWHQRFIPGRSTEFADWIADSLGAALGAVTYVLYDRRRTRTTTSR